MQVVFHGVVLSITNQNVSSTADLKKKKGKKPFLSSFPSHTLFVFTIAVTYPWMKTNSCHEVYVLKTA